MQYNQISPLIKSSPFPNQENQILEFFVKNTSIKKEPHLNSSYHGESFNQSSIEGCEMNMGGDDRSSLTPNSRKSGGFRFIANRKSNLTGGRPGKGEEGKLKS